GVHHLTLPDRATISNMSPEYGATIGLFPVDEETLRYFKMTGRTKAESDLFERYMKAQGMFYTAKTLDPEFTDTIELDLSKVEPSLAGPKRPQDRVALMNMKNTFHTALTAPAKDRGYALEES